MALLDLNVSETDYPAIFKSLRMPACITIQEAIIAIAKDKFGLKYENFRSSLWSYHNPDQGNIPATLFTRVRCRKRKRK